MLLVPFGYFSSLILGTSLNHFPFLSILDTFVYIKRTSSSREAAESGKALDAEGISADSAGPVPVAIVETITAKRQARADCSSLFSRPPAAQRIEKNDPARSTQPYP